MKKYFVMFLSLIAALNFVRAETDPGQQYADAFILMQDGQAAVQSSNWTSAFQKYTSAKEILDVIHKDSPDWNPHVVVYRLNDISDKLEAVRSKVPTPPPAPAAGVVPVAAAPVAVEPSSPAPAMAAISSDLEQLKMENRRLILEIDALKPNADTGAQKIKALKQENKQLSEKLSTRDNEIASLKQKRAAKSDESAELKKLRSDLASTKTELDNARKAQAAAPVVVVPKVTAPAQQSHNFGAAAKPVESPELKKLRSELADTKADADKARTAQQHAVAKLQHQNQDLTAQLDAAKKVAAAKPVESPELKKLRSDLAATKAELDNSRKAQMTAAKVTQAAQQSSEMKIVDLQKQITDLKSALADAKKQTAAPVVPPKVVTPAPAPAPKAAAPAPAAKVVAPAPTQNFGPAK